MFGLQTLLVVFPLIIGMVVAAFFTYPQFVFAQSEMAVLYLVVFLVRFFTGAGKYSAAHLIRRWVYS